MDKYRLEDIVSFTEDRLWSLKNRATEFSCLAHDYNIAGLDGRDFMLDYAHVFELDIGDLDWVTYFGEEVGGNPFGLIEYVCNRFVKRIPARDLIDLPEISLGHLLDCANSGRWKNPLE